MMPGRPAAGHPRGGPPRRPDHPSVPPLPPRLSRRPPGTRLRRSGHPGHSPHARTRQHLLLDAVRCLRRVTISFLLWRDGGRDVCLFPSSTPTCVKPPLPSRMSERSYHVFFFLPPSRPSSDHQSPSPRIPPIHWHFFSSDNGAGSAGRARRFMWNHAGRGATITS